MTDKGGDFSRHFAGFPKQDFGLNAEIRLFGNLRRDLHEGQLYQISQFGSVL
ncbi:MAG: hypothetical protein ABJL67_15150 [Sulfitobacter sp.]